MNNSFYKIQIIHIIFIYKSRSEMQYIRISPSPMYILFTIYYLLINTLFIIY